MRSEQEGTGAGAEGEDEPIVANYHREGLLDDRDLLDFIEKHLVTREGHPEYYLTLMQDMFSDPTLPISNTIFVENAVTGTFSALSTGPSHATREKAVSKGMKDENKLLENVPKGSGDGSNDYPELGKKALLVPPFPMRISVSEADEMQARKTDEWTLVTMEYRNFAFMRRLGFLIFQGLVGGFAVVTLYVRTSSTGGDVGFLETYAPISNELRRYFFLLTTLSVTGSFDLVISTISTATAKSSLLDHLSLAPAQAPRWLHGQRMRLFLSFVVAVLHLLAFLATLVMSRVDVLAHQNALLQEVDGVEVLQGTNKDRVDEWVSLDSLRWVVLLLAWLGCVLLLWMEIARFTRLWHTLRSMRKIALAWMRRTRTLEGGPEMDRLSRQELQEVISSLEIGLQRAKGALTLKEATDILVVHR